MFKGLNIIEFSRYFPDDASCYRYLAEIKWRNGYRCASCGNGKYYGGSQPEGRVCTKCHYDESVTAHTLFHQLKFSLNKAFYLIFLVGTGKKGLSTHELSRKLSLRQKTCWLFKRKVMEAMKGPGQRLLQGKVQVDEFFIGGAEESKPGRSKGAKRQVVIALQTLGSGIVRSYAQVIPAASTVELEAFFDKHIDRSAAVRTDKWSAYTALKKTYDGLTQEKSNKGKTFPLLHRQIMMLKAWLRGIHHHCKHLQAYLNEFNYRFNNHKIMDTLFDQLISGMMSHPKRIYHQLKEA